MTAKHNILIVDDNEKLGNTLLDILQLEGHKVSYVNDGYKAIEAVKNRKFNDVLLDVKMPGISGIETLKIIKNLNPEINVIMITAFADDIFYRDELKSIKFQVMQKPIDIAMLITILDS